MVGHDTDEDDVSAVTAERDVVHRHVEPGLEWLDEQPARHPRQEHDDVPEMSQA